MPSPQRERDESVLWTLRKGEHTASASIRIISDVGDELVYRWNGDVRETRLFRVGQGGTLFGVAAEKRRELEARGWVLVSA